MGLRHVRIVGLADAVSLIVDGSDFLAFLFLSLAALTNSWWVLVLTAQKVKNSQIK